MSNENFIKLSSLLNEIKKNENKKVNFIELPYAKLNQEISGIHRGDIVLLESRASMGTTTFCINLAVQLSKQKYKIAYISLDLPPAEIAKRIETCLTNTKSIDNENNIIDNLEIYISKKRRFSDFDILTEIQEMNNKYKIDLFILDYIQLVNPFTDNLTNSDQDIRDYIESFKHAVRQLNTSLIIVSKLKNDVENDKLMPPGLLDCNISWATDIVLVLDRLDVYGCQQDVHGESTVNKCYLMIYKNKYGEKTDLGNKTDFYVDFEKYYVNEI